MKLENSNNIEPGDLIQVPSHDIIICGPKNLPEYIVVEVRNGGMLLLYYRCGEHVDRNIARGVIGWVQYVLSDRAKKVGTATIEQLLTHSSEKIRQIGLEKVKASHEV